uniref:Steroid 17-alpha-hydroxylase/17,20 lyase n=1 Tax=Pelodiscus sinensis TaxID=13735 RepID=K7F881_PELSI
MVPLLVTLLLVLLALLCFWRLAKGDAQPRAKYPPSLPSLPIIGSLLHLAGNSQLHLFFHSLQKKYGSVFSLQLGSQYMVVVNHYLHAKEVLLKKGKTFAGRPHTVTTDMLTWDGKDIAFATYSPLWKLQRKLVHAALALCGKGALALEKIICQEAASLCETLGASQDVLLDMGPELSRAITNVVCALCFSSSYRRGDPEFEAMLKYSQGIVDTVAQQHLVDIFPWLKVFPNKTLALLKRSLKVRDQLLLKKLEEHKEALGSSSVNDLMDTLLRAQLNLENNNGQLAPPLVLTAERFVLSGVGVRTTALGSHAPPWANADPAGRCPQVQSKIQAELDRTIGFARRPQLSDREQLPYLEATICEVLRIRPVSPLLIPHVALADASIGKYTIPKGTQVIVNLWALHHDEEEWDQPGDFRPERFLDAQGNCRPPSPSYLPFGAGIRVCMGKALAKMEIFLILAWILQRFTLENPPGQPLPTLEGKFGVVLQIYPFQVQARQRAAWQNGL